MAEKKASLLLLLKDKVSKGIGIIGGRLNKLAGQLDKSKFLFAGVAAGTAFLAKQFIGAADKMEQWSISFETMLGSAGAAKEMMAEVSEFAAKTPFELPEVVTGTKRLLAFGIEGEKIIPTLKSLGDVSAGLGVPMERLILNFGQVKAQTKLTGRELRDFAIAGVPLLAELAKGLNKTEAEITDMVSRGKIGFPEVEAAFLSMSGAGGRFSNLMEKQMTTVTGVFSNVQDAAFRLSADLGRYLLPAAKAVGRAIIGLFEWISNLTPKTKLLILAGVGLAGAFSAIVVGAAALAFILPSLIAGFGLLTSPITLTIGAVLGLTAVIVGLVTNAGGMRDKLINIFTELSEIITLILQGMAEAYMLHFGEAKEKLAEAWERIKEITVETWDGVKTKVTDTLDSIVKKVGISEKKISKIKKKAAADEIKDKIKVNKMLAYLDSQRGKDVESSLAFISTLANAHNKNLARLGKITGVATATIDTYRAINKALSSAPPPWNYALAAGVATAGFANVAKIRGVPLAEGGVVLPTAGGTVATIGEAGKAEAVIPLDDDRAKEAIDDAMGGTTVIIQAGTIIADETSITEFAEKIDEKLFELKHNGESVS